MLLINLYSTEQPRGLPNQRSRRGPLSRCQTSISRRTRFSSCKTCPKARHKPRSRTSSPSSCFFYLSTKRRAQSYLIRRYPNLVEVRMVPAKKDIAFIEYADEASSGDAKDALHNYKLDGEQKIKVRAPYLIYLLDAHSPPRFYLFPDYVCSQVVAMCYLLSCVYILVVVSCASI